MVKARKSNKSSETVIPVPRIKKPISGKVTRTSLTQEENIFLEKIAIQEPYIDFGKMYTLRTPEAELLEITNRINLSEEHLPIITTLMSHIVKHESQWNYGAF